MSRTTLALLAPVLAASLLACGGDDGLSKEEHIAQGDAVCQRFEDEGSELDPPASLEEVPAYLDSTIGIAESAVADLRALDPPGEGADVHEALVGSLEAGVTALREAKAAAQAGQQDAIIDALTEAGDVVEAANAEAREYGFEVCGRERPGAEAPAG